MVQDASLRSTAAGTAASAQEEPDPRTSLLWFVGELVPITAPADCSSEHCRTSPEPQTFPPPSDTPEDTGTGDFSHYPSLSLYAAHET